MEKRDSPFLVLDDYATELGNNFQKQRLLRNKIEINRIVVLPLINRENEIVMSKLTKFSNPENETIILGSTDKLMYEELFKNKANLEGELADLFISVVQGAGSLNSVKRIVKEEKSNKIGDAIKNISHKINVLAEEQHLAAIQIPDGPQRIRGMAGTGKTIILTIKAAYLHAFEPDAKILYGGGYIVVGVEEENGVAMRPVKGLPEYMLDSIQKDMLAYNNLISPPYFPQGIPAEVDGKWIFVIVVRTGQQRPYKSPEHVTSKKEKKYNYYIRYQTSSVKANSEQERELINMSDQTPFDCRANHKATFEDISPVLLEDHLRKTGSKLAKQVRERGVEEILNDMQLLVGSPELRYIQNVAIMMFCEHPEKFFGYTYVQMTSFPKGSVENPSISEDFPNITGSVPQMIQATMERFRNLIIREKVIKVPNQMEALRIFNYPYQAIEEAVVNAFYHRDYMSYEPVTIEIEPDCINIMNFPGIDRSISEKTIAEGKRFVSRYYRNRRLGEFLKELDLSEGHSSGIPTIQEELEKNGSPRAEFFTDEDRRAMRIRIPIHPAFLEADDEVLLPDSYEKATKKSSKKKIEQYEKILKLLNDGEWHKTAEIADNLGLKDTRTKELLKELIALDKLIDNGKTKGKLYRLK